MTDGYEQLLPRPQRSEINDDTFTFPEAVQIHLENAVQETTPLARRLQQTLGQYGVAATLTAVSEPIGTPAVRLRLDPDEAVYIQGYRMNITNATLFPDLEGLARSVALELEMRWKALGRSGQDPG